jgi:hypothetical protein
MSPHPPCRLPQVLTLISQVGTRRAVQPCLEGYRFATLDRSSLYITCWLKTPCWPYEHGRLSVIIPCFKKNATTKNQDGGPV